MEDDKKKRIKKEIKDWVICFVIAYLIYIVINYFLGTVSGIKQISMYPTAQEGEKVIIERRILFNKTLKRGDIVIFPEPDDIAKEDFIAYYKTREGISEFFHNFLKISVKSYIKRVVALEGEHIYISEDGQVYINDELLEETYLQEVSTQRLGNFYDLIVPEGCIFVMGDNRDHSQDSREFGCILKEKVDGIVKTRIWPLNRLGEI